MTTKQLTPEQQAANKKRAETNIEIYGVPVQSQRPEVKAVLQQSKLHGPARQLLDRDWFYDQYIKQRKSARNLAAELGINKSTIVDYAKKYGISKR